RAMEAVSYEEFEYKDLYQNASRAVVRAMEAVSYEEFEYKDLYQNASRAVGDDKFNWL
ncbi:hypothetical protein KI387_002981, partial [Taxus chinensis]